MAKAISSNLSQTLQNVNSSLNNLGTRIWSRRHPLTMAKISLATRLLARTEEPQSRNVLCEILFSKCFCRVFSRTKNVQIFIYSALNGYLYFVKPETKIMAALWQWYKGSYYRNTRFHDTQLFQRIKLWRVILSCREFQESTAFLGKKKALLLIPIPILVWQTTVQ